MIKRILCSLFGHDYKQNFMTNKIKEMKCIRCGNFIYATNIENYNKKTKGVDNMTPIKLKGQAYMMPKHIWFEFGRVQANMNISKRGSAARKLKLKIGDFVEITIKKIKK